MVDAEDRLAVVTGGSFGLGLALCRHLMAANFVVLACGRSEERLGLAAAELPGLKTLSVDVTEPSDQDRLFEAITEAGCHSGAPTDLFVNNAAISRSHDYTSDFTLEKDRARDEIETNFAAPVELIRRFLALRRENGWEERPATIANISTPGALFPLEPNPIYSCSKAGFHFFTSSLRRQRDGHDRPGSRAERPRGDRRGGAPFRGRDPCGRPHDPAPSAERAARAGHRRLRRAARRQHEPDPRSERRLGSRIRPGAFLPAPSGIHDGKIARTA